MLKNNAIYYNKTSILKHNKTFFQTFFRQRIQKKGYFMYENFRSCFMSKLNLDNETIKIVLVALDSVADDYDFIHKERSVTTYSTFPQEAKQYLVSKKIEGLSPNTLEQKKLVLDLFFREIRKPIFMITTNDVRLYLYNYQTTRNVSQSRLDNIRIHLNAFFEWCSMDGMIDKNPMKPIKKIKQEKKLKEGLTQKELEIIRGCEIDTRDRAIIEFIYSTGCRVDELTKVKKSDINWNDNSVILFGKGSKERISYINAKSLVSLNAYLKTRKDDSEYLFVTYRRPFRQLDKDTVEKSCRILSAKSGIKFTPHTLRRTTATTALNNGMEIDKVQKLLGHESINTTLIYAHTSQSQVQASHIRCVI